MRILSFLVLLALFLLACGGESDNTLTSYQAADGTIDVDNIMALAKEKYLAAATQLDTAKGLPRNAYADGSWRQVPLSDWTSGFFPGVLWQLYAYDEDAAVIDAAQKWMAKLRPNKYFHDNHDIGFVMFNSFGRAYELTGDKRYYEPTLTAAATGIERFNPASGVIKSWDNEGAHPTIIDNMMNLRLYTFAFAETGDSIYFHVVKSHADTTLRHHFRSDGGTWHVLDYFPDGSGVKIKKTHQGYADGSLWARGQAWAIYGYLETYQSVPDPAYLAIARKAADLFLERLPADIIPYWDFDAPNIPDEPKDASAAAIAASALLDLAKIAGEERYATEAKKLLHALSSPKYLAGVSSDIGGLLRHSTGNRNKENQRKGEVDMHIIYADYYYLEALNKLLAFQ